VVKTFVTNNKNCSLKDFVQHARPIVDVMHSKTLVELSLL